MGGIKERHVDGLVATLAVVTAISAAEDRRLGVAVRDAMRRNGKSSPSVV
jgi:hypothetical protein